MEDRLKFRIPKYTDKNNFHEFEYLCLGEDIGADWFGNNKQPEQCTGLKDKNGDLIYEGDIIKKGRIKYNIEWYRSFCKWIYLQDGRLSVHDLCINESDNYEIIGNIHTAKQED